MRASYATVKRALLKPREDFYTATHPVPDDVLLSIEVADTTVPYDREIKVPLYASTGIPEVWLIDLARKPVEVYRQPTAQGYPEVLRSHANEPVRCALLPQVSLFPAELWPTRVRRNPRADAKARSATQSE